MSVVLLAMQTEVIAIFASITSTQDTRAPFTGIERTPTERNARLFARSLDKNHSPAEHKQGVKPDVKRDEATY